MDTLRLIGEEPKPAQVRQRRFQQLDLWGVAVKTANDDHLILWGDSTGETIIQYIGSDL